MRKCVRTNLVHASMPYWEVQFLQNHVYGCVPAWRQNHHPLSQEPCPIITPPMGQFCQPEQPLLAGRQDQPYMYHLPPQDPFPHITPPIGRFFQSPLWSELKCMVITLLFCRHEQSLETLNCWQIGSRPGAIEKRVWIGLKDPIYTLLTRPSERVKALV